MRSHVSTFSKIVFGISLLFSVWIAFLLFADDGFSNTPSDSFILLISGACILLLNFGWAFYRLLHSTGSQRIPAAISTIAAGLLLISLIFFAYTLSTPAPSAAVSSKAIFWLLPSSLIVSQFGSLLEVGWGKTNFRAWLRVIGTACISGVILFGFLLAWSLWW